MQTSKGAVSLIKSRYKQMWMTSIINDERLQSVVFFLSDTLRSILEDCEALQASRCAPPSIGKEASCEEIFLQLDQFRNQVRFIRSREAIMVAKLVRAREWAQLLKGLAPSIKPEINLFLLGTVFCGDLQQALLPNVQQEFNGGSLSKRFISERLREEDVRSNGIPAASDGVSYIIAGKVRIEDLMLACERMLTTLDNNFDLYEELVTEPANLDEPLELNDVIAEIAIPDDAAQAEMPASGDEPPKAAMVH